ncbi:MAG TPA: DHH family phosphoesterase [candidate division Zixibacteria bacterium]|nr:DHH family phosphoesterase [candidate division Zixibacteria bacterium]
MSSDTKKQDFQGFIAKIREGIDSVKDAKDAVLCISHIDADGLTSAGIIGKAFHREGIDYHIRSVRQLELPIISEISMMKNIKNIVFTDLGGGQLEGINKYLANRNIVILDHHPVLTPPESESIILVNPFDFNYDGANQISGAGITYFFAKEMNKKNIDSACYAVVGALADRQDKGEKNSLIALNRNIVEDGIKSGLLEEKLDIRLFGRETRAIYQALEYTTDPFLPGLTGDGDMCIRFMRDTGIPQQKGEKWRTLQDLSDDERRTLVQSLITYGLQMGMTAEDSQSILGMVYVLTKEKPGTLLRDAREFGSLINSCGRLNANGIAIGLIMGERKFLLQEAEEIMANYRRKISDFLQIINQESEHLKEYAQIIVFDGKNVIDDSMIGTITSIAISTKKFMDKKKPLVGLALSEDGSIKVSCRATGELVSKGLDLGLALREAVTSLGSEAEGGGHNIAAGARIPQGTEKLLIESLNVVIEKQLDKKKKEETTNDKTKEASTKSK